MRVPCKNIVDSQTDESACSIFEKLDLIKENIEMLGVSLSLSRLMRALRNDRHESKDASI